WAPGTFRCAAAFFVVQAFCKEIMQLSVMRADPEAGLMDLVQRMQGTGFTSIMTWRPTRPRHRATSGGPRRTHGLAGMTRGMRRGSVSGSASDGRTTGGHLWL